MSSGKPPDNGRGRQVVLKVSDDGMGSFSDLQLGGVGLASMPGSAPTDGLLSTRSGDPGRESG
jgi:hypothetical protein